MHVAMFDQVSVRSAMPVRFSSGAPSACMPLCDKTRAFRPLCDRTLDITLSSPPTSPNCHHLAAILKLMYAGRVARRAE